MCKLSAFNPKYVYIWWQVTIITGKFFSYEKQVCSETHRKCPPNISSQLSLSPIICCGSWLNFVQCKLWQMLSVLCGNRFTDCLKSCIEVVSTTVNAEDWRVPIRAWNIHTTDASLSYWCIHHLYQGQRNLSNSECAVWFLSEVHTKV